MIMPEDLQPLPGPPAKGSQCQEYAERIGELEEQNRNVSLLEDTLRRNIALFHAVLSRSRSGIILAGPARNVVCMVHAIHGHRTDDLTGMPLEMLVHPDDRDIVLECYRNVLKNPGSSEEFEVRAIGSDGSFIWVEGTLTDMLDNPHVQAIICNYRDITRWKEHDLALVELEAIVQSVDYAIFSTDPDGTVLTWNRGAETSIGYRAQEILGQHFSRLVPGDLHEQACAMHGDVCKTGIACEMRGKRRNKDGLCIPVQLHLAPIFDHYGRVRGVSHMSKFLPGPQ
jgi:PAS domain S-box-containing protein